MDRITAAQPDGEIALGITLKHNATRALANSVTSGYGAPTPAWAKELKLDQSSANAARLVSEWSKYSAGTSINRGPGAKIFGDKMEEISQSSEVKAEMLDERVLRDLLRDKFAQFSFGTINHCLGDPRKAECLKDLDEAVAAQGPIFDACNPVRCHNSVVNEKHMPIWLAEEKEMVKLLRDKRMAGHHRQNLELELEDVRKITKR